MRLRDMKKLFIALAAGVALFTPGNMTDEHWKAFDKAIHQPYTVKP